MNTKVGAITISGGGATKSGKSSKLSLKATPDSGKPPLAVTFSVSTPKVVQWRLDFGDGLFRTGFGQPPSTIAHTYRREGDFRPKLTTISSATATAATDARRASRCTRRR